MDHRFSFNSVSKRHELTSLSINFRMSRNVVFQLSIKVVVSNTLDVEFLLRFVNFDVEWVVSLKHSKSLFLMVAKSCVGSSFPELFKMWKISNG